MHNREYGYARVSTREQWLDRQVDALMTRGLDPQNIFVEKQSGKDFSRAEYARLLRRLRAGDTLFVVSIDRLGRDYREIQEQWRRITREIGADIVVLDMPLLDTRQGKDLTGSFVADLVLQILSYVAQMERENIRARQAAGIAAAKARGVRFGRAARPEPPGFAEVVRAWRRREIALDGALSRLQVGRTWFYEHARRVPDEPNEKNVKAHFCGRRSTPLVLHGLFYDSWSFLSIRKSVPWRTYKVPPRGAAKEGMCP